MPLTHPTARLPGRMTHPTAPSVARAIIAPSLDDLFGLRKLCGSDIGVIEYLANWYDMEADAIAPTVQGWLANCPDVQPPSRQRSAPGALTVNAGMATRSHLSHADDPFKTTSSSFVAATAALRHPRAASIRPPEVLPIKTPPASAPVQSAPSIAAALSATNHRLSKS